MKVLNLNKKEGVAKIKITSKVDLEYLSKVIEQGDLVSGYSERKLKFGGEHEKQRVEKRSVFLKIKVKKLSLGEEELRVLGEIIQGPEDIPLHTTHTIEVSPGKDLTIQKSAWLNYQIELLKEAEKVSSAPTVLICVLDDERANFAYLTPSGIKKLGGFQLRLSKKRFAEKRKDEIKKVAKEVSDIARQNKIKDVVIASPLFWKDEVLKALKQIDPHLSKSVVLTNVSTGSSRAFHELLTNKAIERILKENKAAKDAKLVENLLQKISKNSELVVYGLKEVRRAAELGAISDLLVCECLDKEKVENIIKCVEKSRGKVHIIDKKTEAGKKLRGLGGIAGFLKFKISL